MKISVDDIGIIGFCPLVYSMHVYTLYCSLQDFELSRLCYRRISIDIAALVLFRKS